MSSLFYEKLQKLMFNGWSDDDEYEYEYDGDGDGDDENVS